MTRINQLFFIASLLLLAPVSLASQNPCIAVITVGSGQFWTQLIKGAKQASTELGITMYHRAPIDEKNVLGQKNMINNAKGKGCSAFVIAPNSVKINSLVDELQQSDIPTIYVDRDYGGQRQGIVSTDNYLAGQLAAKEMLKALQSKGKTKGKVVIFRQSHEVLSSSERARGFRQAATEAGLEVLEDVLIGNKVGRARRNPLIPLKQLKDVDGIFTVNETTTLGVLLNLLSLGKAGQYLHIGFDSHPLMIEALEKGQLHGFMVQYPFQMGYQSVMNAYKVMHGIKIESEVNSQVYFVNKDNVKKAETQAALNF